MSKALDLVSKFLGINVYMIAFLLTIIYIIILFIPGLGFIKFTLGFATFGLWVVLILGSLSGVINPIAGMFRGRGR